MATAVDNLVSARLLFLSLSPFLSHTHSLSLSSSLFLYLSIFFSSPHSPFFYLYPSSRVFFQILVSHGRNVLKAQEKNLTGENQSAKNRLSSFLCNIPYYYNNEPTIIRRRYPCKHHVNVAFRRNCIQKPLNYVHDKPTGTVAPLLREI